MRRSLPEAMAELCGEMIIRSLSIIPLDPIAPADRPVVMTGHQADPRWDNFVRKIGGVMLYKPFQFHEMMERIQVVLRKAAQK